MSTLKMSIEINVAIFLFSGVLLTLTELSARMSQGLHQVPGTPPDVLNAVIGTEEFRTEAESRRTYTKPTRNIPTFDATHWKHFDIARQHGAERL